MSHKKYKLRKFLSVTIVLFLIVGVYQVNKFKQSKFKQKVEQAIDEYIEEYGIPKDQIRDSNFANNPKNRGYEKKIWTMQDEGDIYYLFGYDERKEEVYLDFYVYGNVYSYAPYDEKIQSEFDQFLEKHQFKLYYYPPINQ